MTKKMNWIDWVALILLVIGGVNWGLIGLLNYNLLTSFLSSVSWLIKTIYILVGISAVYLPIKLIYLENK